PDRPDFKLPSVEIVREVVGEAHRHGMKVLLHATTPAGHRFAQATGVDVVVHGLWEWPGSFHSATQVPPDILQIGDSLAGSGLCIQPTVQTLRSTATLFEPALLDNLALADVLPGAFIRYLRTDAQAQRGHFLQRFGSQIIREQLTGDLLANETARVLSHVNRRYEREIGRWSQLGSCLLLGTDTAVGGFGW